MSGSFLVICLDKDIKLCVLNEKTYTKSQFFEQIAIKNVTHNIKDGRQKFKMAAILKCIGQYYTCDIKLYACIGDKINIKRRTFYHVYKVSL